MDCAVPRSSSPASYRDIMCLQGNPLIAESVLVDAPFVFVSRDLANGWRPSSGVITSSVGALGREPSPTMVERLLTCRRT